MWQWEVRGVAMGGKGCVSEGGKGEMDKSTHDQW